jgi:PBP1b-binding outer membrane lipoprotein LpoB
MKKFALLLVIVMLTVLFSSCSKEYMEFEELNDGSKLKYGNTVYFFTVRCQKHLLKASK